MSMKWQLDRLAIALLQLYTAVTSLKSSGVVQR